VGLVLSAVLAFRSLAYIRSKLLPGTPLYSLYWFKSTHTDT
jgi:hypothetical protein